MKTLSEHNQQIREREKALKNINLCGVSCDKCGAAMVYMNRTSPVGAGQYVNCTKCNYSGILLS